LVNDKLLVEHKELIILEFTKLVITKLEFAKPVITKLKQDAVVDDKLDKLKDNLQ